MKPWDPICNECAIEKGFEFLEEHLATVSILICSVCEIEKPCSEVSDWRRK